jgi:polyisoprenoid-binding protein YceI
MQTCRVVCAVVAAMTLTLPSFAQAPQRIVAEKSQIRFAFKQMNVPVEGRFRKFDAIVSFDPTRPDAARAEFEVDLGSIDLGGPEGETEARRKSWFNVEAFPKAKFVAAKVTSTGPGKYEASGPLTIKGVTQGITAPFTLAETGGMRNVEGQFLLRRLQFGIGEGAWSDTQIVADEVTVRFKFVIPAEK